MDLGLVEMLLPVAYLGASDNCFQKLALYLCLGQLQTAQTNRMRQEWTSLRTAAQPRQLGIVQIRQPSRIPDQEVTLAQLTDGVHPNPNQQVPMQGSYPFPNVSTFRLAHWYHNSGVSGSRESLSKLVKDVLQSGDFEVEHLDKQSMEKLDRLLDKMDQRESRSNEGDVAQGSSWDGWKEEGVRIQVPTGVKTNRRPQGEDASQTFEVKSLHRRQLVDVIRSTFESEAAADFHFDPFTTHWEMPSWMPPLNPSADKPDTR